MPLFAQDRIPDFLPTPAFYTYGLHTFSRPENFDNLSAAAKGSITKELDEASIARYYELKHYKEIEKIENPSKLEPRLWRLFESCHMSLSGSLQPLRSDLCWLFEPWPALELPGACPFSFTEAEIQRQIQQISTLLAFIEVNNIVYDKLSTDLPGWIANDKWEETVKVNEQLHEDFVQTVRKGMDAESATQRWPFPPKESNFQG